jgi:hypothetical protein
VPKLSVDVEGILSDPHGSFEERNKVLEPSIIIIIIRQECDSKRS